MYELTRNDIGTLLPHGNIDHDVLMASFKDFNRWFRSKVEIVKGPLPNHPPKGHGLKLPRIEDRSCFGNAGQLFVANNVVGQVKESNRLEVWHGLGIGSGYGITLYTPLPMRGTGLTANGWIEAGRRSKANGIAACEFTKNNSGQCSQSCKHGGRCAGCSTQ